MVKMTTESKEGDSSNISDSVEEVIKEEVNLQYHLYITIFGLIYYISWVISGIGFFAYVLLYFLPNFLEVENFFSLFIELKPLIALIMTPLIFLGCYLVHLLLLALTTRIFWRISEKITPSKSGIIPRNIRSRAANAYHMRSFMIKYGKNTFTKGIFPWLSKWFFNFIGSSKIGKGSILEESVGNDKFIQVGENAYIGINSTLASHLIRGIFGDITYFKIKVGDNVTTAAMNQVGPGTEIHNNSFLLPLASVNPHSILTGNAYYYGIPLRKIFRRKVMDYLGLTSKHLEINDNIAGYRDKKLIKKLKEDHVLGEFVDDVSENDEINEESGGEKIITEKLTKEQLAIDFTTSSAISRVNIKFLIVYLPIFWISGLLVSIFWYWYFLDGNWTAILIFLPLAIFGSIYFFILGIILFSKLLLILVNLIHKPKEGVFKAEIRNTDYEFWMLRTELKKISLWFMRNSPLPFTDSFALRILGVNMDFSSHLNDAWCDSEFINFGRRSLIGQGAAIMSSMVVGKYLLIKKIIFDDYVMIGGHTSIAPGTIVGKESVVGAISTTTYDQILEPNWIYFGIPVIKLKENKYAQGRRDIIIRRDVDKAKKFEEVHEVNIDEDKKRLIKIEREEEK
jgi:acetyltransferase-like isoleucine patch superfamily enzyme